ncbi:MAG: hypothetical protein PHS62_00185 [Patescibacteria group bacterium]|nr:hypothetical protein [Patescibacteria group bacterium]
MQQTLQDVSVSKLFTMERYLVTIGRVGSRCTIKAEVTMKSRDGRSVTSCFIGKSPAEAVSHAMAFALSELFICQLRPVSVNTAEWDVERIYARLECDFTDQIPGHKCGQGD